MVEWKYSSTHSYTDTSEVSGQLQAAAAVNRRGASGSGWVPGCVDPTAGLDALPGVLRDVDWYILIDVPS
jgi:hypothetical protein